MATLIDVENFLELYSQIPVVDVRTPSEYAKGHIHGAHNIPLFLDNERASVGTIYKRKNRQEAILKGLDFVGPKLREYIEKAVDIAQNNTLVLYCWRGGMRSASLAWLFDLYGISTYILKGGYKAYRNYGKELMCRHKHLIVLGGLTGSGKTEILHELQNQGEQIIDLENLAHHKGSAFGALGQEPQPANEQFENELIHDWLQLDQSKRIWIEDESRSIGGNWIPDELFNVMRNTTVIKLEMPKDQRIRRLMKEYAGFPNEKLADKIHRISRRLGGQNAKKAIEALDEGNMYTVIDIVLSYYDKTYQFGLNKRDKKSIYSYKYIPGKDNVSELITFCQNF